MREAPPGLPPRRDPADGAAVGVLNLDRGGRVVRHTPAADRLLGEIGGPQAGRRKSLPMAVSAVVGTLRRMLRSGSAQGPANVSSLHVRGHSGRWLTLQASLAEDPDGGPAETVVVIAPAGPGEAALLNATAYGLSAREREVVGLVLGGFSTREISRSLFISESTVQGHLSHVFEKVGVKSRRELLKRLYLDNLSSPVSA